MAFDAKRNVICVMLSVVCMTAAADLTDVYMMQLNQQLMQGQQIQQALFQEMMIKNAQHAEAWQQVGKDAESFLEDVELMSTDERRDAYRTWRKRIAKLERLNDGGEEARREFARRYQAFSMYRDDIGMDCGVYIDRTCQQAQTAVSNMQQAFRDQQIEAQKQMSDTYNSIRNNSPAKYNEHRCSFCGDTYYGMKCPCRMAPKFGMGPDRVIYDEKSGKVIKVIY